MTTIKIANHITAGEILRWKKKGALIECHGFNLYVITDSSILSDLINKANAKK